MITAESIFVSTEAKVNYLKSLIRLAKSDGKIQEQEMIYFIQAAQQLEVGSQAEMDVKNAWESDTIKIEFETMREKMFDLIQLYHISWIDGEIAPEELTEIRNIAKELGIRDENVQKVEDWFLDGIAWTKRGDELIDLD